MRNRNESYFKGEEETYIVIKEEIDKNIRMLKLKLNQRCWLRLHQLIQCCLKDLKGNDQLCIISFLNEICLYVQCTRRLHVCLTSENAH